MGRMPYMDEGPARSEPEELRTAIRAGYEISMKQTDRNEPIRDGLAA